MTVLVGYVPTAEGEAAFAAALEEARAPQRAPGGAQLPARAARRSAPTSPPERRRSGADRRAPRRPASTLEVRQAPHSGDVADEVLRVAQEADASVIVIGLRKRSPVGKLLMGSSAQRILLDADRPVLAVKP